MADEIRRWSDELARDPSSLVFLQLGEALRRQGELDVALKIGLRGLERHPFNPAARDLVARIAVDRRDLARAFDEWQAVLELVPDHVGALKGLGYVCFQQGRLEDAERYLSRAASGGAGPDVSNALATVRRSSGSEHVATVLGAARVTPSRSTPHVAAPAAPPPSSTPASKPPRRRTPQVATVVAAPVPDRRPPAAAPAPSAPPAGPAPVAAAAKPAPGFPTDPQWMFADLLLDDTQTALLLDGSGLVVGGVYIDVGGTDVSQEVGARLSGISEEVARAAQHLDLGAWRSMTFETHIAVVAMAPAEEDTLLVVAASRATPLGFIRRLLDRCTERAAEWMVRVGAGLGAASATRTNGNGGVRGGNGR